MIEVIQTSEEKPSCAEVVNILAHVELRFEREARVSVCATGPASRTDLEGVQAGQSRFVCGVGDLVVRD